MLEVILLIVSGLYITVTASLECLTMGISGFAECQGHSAKPNLHSAKALPSAALGECHSAKNGPAKASLPSVFCWTLGKAFAECPTLGKVGTEKNPKK